MLLPRETHGSWIIIGQQMVQTSESLHEINLRLCGHWITKLVRVAHDSI